MLSGPPCSPIQPLILPSCTSDSGAGAAALSLTKRGPTSAAASSAIPNRMARRERDLTLRMRLALRIDDLLELAQHMHARQQLLQAAVRLALFLDRGDELAVFQLDT